MTQSEALSILKSGRSIFLTGEPGSGKSFTVRRYVEYLRGHDIEPVITAATGIAATHIGGTTIHSWAGIGIARELSSGEIKKIAEGSAGKRIRRAKMLIIDEVSMIDAATLALIDKVCRKSREDTGPFGGLQMVLVGDFFQLPPIARNGETARFAFESEAWQELDPAVCYLTEQHRQEDQTFLEVLNAIRAGDFDGSHTEHLDARIAPVQSDYRDITKLYSHNANVDQLNSVELGRLAGQEHLFEMSSHGPKPLVETLQRGCISPAKLYLKVGATVMFTKNSPRGTFVNGTLGKVVRFDNDTHYPIIRTRTGNMIEVEPMDWTIEENGYIKAKVTQTPLRLAWAITIHKSQGMSLDAAVMDLRKVFEYGQGYVALSRVRSLAGLHLLGYSEHALLVHPDILDKDKDFRDESKRSSAQLCDISDKAIECKNNDFILMCEGNLIIQNTKDKTQKQRFKTAKVSTADQTLALFREGKSIDAICKERNLTGSTIVGHLEKLIATEKISQKEVLPLLDERILQAIPVIHAAFRDLETTNLSPVFTKFQGTYSYLDIQMARLALQNDAPIIT